MRIIRYIAKEHVFQTAAFEGFDEPEGWDGDSNVTGEFERARGYNPLNLNERMLQQMFPKQKGTIVEEVNAVFTEHADAVQEACDATIAAGQCMRHLAAAEPSHLSIMRQ